MDGRVPVSVQTLRGATCVELTMRRAGTFLMGAMGEVGLLLAIVGLYARDVVRRGVAHDRVGIRMALGASAGRIRREMLREPCSLWRQAW